MIMKKIHFRPESAVSNPVDFNPDICDGCNRCVEVCQVDILIPNPEKRKPPIVAFPGECWLLCGCLSKTGGHYIEGIINEQGELEKKIGNNIKYFISLTC